ncbi:MAG: ADP-ribosylglycohydrolase family protein, partial [Candidatus Hydrogenedentes bacterium]|nr:ADP-ribosylglycohydrolase family protein [Candidatus Hydrogenedentota bacterium]
TGPMDPWTDDRIANAIGQDDCYVEMTFLKALEEHGLDVTYAQAGQAFADTQYPLWHANKYGRENVRRGIMPPLSGHPSFNKHADDIDFQIEADLFGILCPGLPEESNRLCDIFGHIMNYGDGVYGGMFVSGMYASAYFEGNDVEKVVRDGLACIPENSDYHRCISDVLAWHKKSPRNWQAAWKRIEKKWQDDVDCEPGNPFNIDAKLNGAYIVMGLLYGEGDFLKTAEIATRCGQDADCNPSNAVGVLGCMKGFNAMQPLLGGLATIADTNFSHTTYSFNTLIPACQRVTESIIQRAGGSITADGYAIPRQAARPPETLEQWVRQIETLRVVLPQSEVDLWNPAWRVIACGPDMSPGLRDEEFGRKNVLVIHPVDREHPASLIATFDVPAQGSPQLIIDAASDTRGDYVLRIFINEELKAERTIATHGEWTTVSVDLMPFTGKTIDVRLENAANGWEFEAAYLARAVVE